VPILWLSLNFYFLGTVITPVSDMLWKSNGRVSLHSIDDGMWILAIILRWAAKASQITKMNIINAVSDTIAPIDEITFYFINASG